MKTLLLALLALLVLAPDAAAQKRTIETRTPVDSTTSIVVTETIDVTPRHRMVIVDPLRFFALFNAAYYQRVAPKLALGAGVQVPAFAEVDGVRLQGEVRYYPSGGTLKGFYLAPNVWFSSLGEEDLEESRLSAGAIAGWQWFAGHDFGIEFGLGARVRLTESELYDEVYNGVIPVIRFRIGYAF